MTKPIVKIKKVDPAAVVPSYMTTGAAGCDVHSVEECTIFSGQRRMVDTGLTVEIPPGYECQVRPRSGLAFKHGVTVFNTPGTVDSDYRGRMKVLLHNASEDDYTVRVGDRIAQLVFAEVSQVLFEESDELSTSERGEGGWGSTGIKNVVG